MAKGVSVVERVYELVLSAGYPVKGIDWLRRHRLATIVVMAFTAWALLIGLVWLIWFVLT